jgi:hypothetical protein
VYVKEERRMASLRVIALQQRYTDRQRERLERFWLKIDQEND